MKSVGFIRSWKLAPALAAVQILCAMDAAGGSLVAAGRWHSVLVDEPHGITQSGITGSINLSLPGGLASGPSWIAVSTGNDHGLAINGSGVLFSWGSNGNGQLGRPSTNGERTALRVGTDEDWAYVAACGNRSAAIKSDGSLWTWGVSPTGIDGVNQSAVPLRVGDDDSWKSVALGTWHSLALRDDGSLWAWGYNNHYSLGDGTNVSSAIPVRIGSDNDWAEVACGAYTSFAIKTDGSLWVWGGATHASVYGMGSGIQAPLQVPTTTGTGNEWKSIHPAVNGSFVLALKRNGTLWSWGGNPQGALGHGDTAGRDTPTQVGTFNDWHAVAAGETHSIATRTDGSVWHWGMISMNQLPAATVPTDRSAMFAPVAGMRVFTTFGSELNHPNSRLTCRTTILNEPADNLLRLRNDGLLPLTIFEIVVPAGFGISSAPATVPPLQEETLSLHLTASSKGAFAGNLLIRSNRHSIAEFNIQLVGQVVSADDDTDGDGLNDAAEAAMSPLGFQWDYPQHNMVEALFTRREMAGLSLEGDVHDIHFKALPPQHAASASVIQLELLDASQSSAISLPPESLNLKSATEAEVWIPLAPDRRMIRLTAGE